MKLILLIFLLFIIMPSHATSSCYGTTSKGKLTKGVELPRSGKNFVTYSDVARLAGRTYVHSKVRDITVAAYKSLEKLEPSKVYKYAETGFSEGGRFKPHKTHQNGLSIDFMTPVIDASGKSVHLPTHPFNRFGYDIEFDKNDEFDEYRIDYVALAAHIVALDKAAKAASEGLWRVIFDPQLQPKLLETQYGAYLKANIEFSKKRSWVRHDEHYHVDFAIKCAKMSFE